MQEAWLRLSRTDTSDVENLGGVQGRSADVDPARQREVVQGFLAASRSGDFAALLAVLDPDVVVRADGAAVAMGSAAEIRGAGDVAERFAGQARAARPALIDGVPGLVWMVQGVVKVAFDFSVVGDRVAGIELIADPELIAALDVELLR